MRLEKLMVVISGVFLIGLYQNCSWVGTAALTAASLIPSEAQSKPSCSDTIFLGLWASTYNERMGLEFNPDCTGGMSTKSKHGHITFENSPARRGTLMMRLHEDSSLTRCSYNTYINGSRTRMDLYCDGQGQVKLTRVRLPVPSEIQSVN